MINKRFLIFIFSVWLAISLHLPAQSESDNGLNKAIAAQQLYDARQLTAAAAKWQEAINAYEAQSDRLGTIKSLINKAQVLQDLGLYPKACDNLLRAFEIENPDCSGEQIDGLIAQFKQKPKISMIQGVGLRSLGNVLRYTGQLEQSRRLLQLSQIVTDNSIELGSTLLALGNVEKAIANQNRARLGYEKITEIIDRQDISLALAPYSKTFSAYKITAADPKTLPTTQVQAQLNYLNLSLELESWWQNQITRRTKTWQRQQETRLIEAAANFTNLLESELQQIQANSIAAIDRNLARISPSHESVYARINYARSLSKLGKTESAKAVLETALAQARAIQDRLGESYVWGYLGKYYARQQEFSKAIALTRQALLIAQGQNANNDVREITYLWNSQLGQLLERQGQISDAISAYTSAFNTLQSLRTDLNANDRVVQFDFRQEVKPVYLSLANLLLQSDISQTQNSVELVATTSRDNSNLELARQVIESLQLAELDNYFQDPCLETSDVAITIDDLDPQAAVVYPIVLSDRIELILSLPNHPLQRFTTRVSQDRVNLAMDLLYDSLYNPSVNNSAVNIFSTTVLDPAEVDRNMQTLLPILQQMYGWLIEPIDSTLTAEGVQTLVFVLNGRLQNVPISALYDGRQYLLEKYGIALAPSLQLLNTKPIARDKVRVLAAGLSEQVEVKGNIFPALNNVPLELEQIETVFPQSRQLLNSEFTTDSIQKQLESDFSVVHLATHGLFSSNPEETFIITGDGKAIDINTLSNLLNSSSINPELVVLSACETAAGDELAILGLAGVAVRSGASSTIASLWSVDDASTALVMSEFYRKFENPDAKKIDALQKAQLTLMSSLRENPPSPTLKKFPPHPYYWSPYVLVGNWQ